MYSVSIYTFFYALTYILYVYIIFIHTPLYILIYIYLYTQYELVVSVANAAGTVNTIVATQLLQYIRASICNHDNCPTDTINTTSIQAYISSNGPYKFTKYTFIIFLLNLTGLCIFTQYLPKQKDECHTWRRLGDKSGEYTRKLTGYISVIIAVVSITYGLTFSILLMIPSLSCMRILGGPGC